MIHLLFVHCWLMLCTRSMPADPPYNTPDYTAVAQQMLYAVRTGEPIATHLQQLAAAQPDSLQAQLHNDARRTAFWLNTYNALVQHLLQQNREQYKSRNAFFTRKQINVAGAALSLDDIEHSILRRSKNKWSFGYLGKLFPGPFEKAFRVNEPDYRIHFALNCGARSCPPIAYYSPEKIDAQLQLATRAYLGTEAEYDSTKNEVRLPAIMGWFRADFGGKRGIIELLRQLQLVPAGAKPAIRFKKYDWTLYLNNYKNETNE